MNAQGKAVLVKYQWVPKVGVTNLTRAEAEAIQAKNFNHATQDRYEATERYRTFEDWERDALIHNLGTALKQCKRDIQERVVYHFSQSHPDDGRRVAQGIGLPVPESAAQPVGD